MSQLPSAHSSSRPVDPSAAPVAEPGFEVTVQAFWNRNRGFIFLLGGIVLLAIVAREGWRYFSEMHEQSLQQDYAQATDQPEKLIAFADANSSHPLAGVAYLQVADRKFEAADYKEASTYYTKAAGSLKNEALLGRAKLGAAVSEIDGGDRVAGEAALKAVSADQSLSKSVRSEATYHLASLAYEAGQLDDARKLVEDVTKIDLGGPWAQRATMMMANLPPSAKPSAGATGFSVKPDGK